MNRVRVLALLIAAGGGWVGVRGGWWLWWRNTPAPRPQLVPVEEHAHQITESLLRLRADAAARKATG